MIRRSPAERYIEYLLVHPDQYANSVIIELMQLKGLDFLGLAYIERLRLGIQLPSPFKPFEKAHAPSSRFLAMKQLYYLFHPDKAMEEALIILDSPQAKETIETMLITDDPHPLVAHRMRSLGLRCDVTTVQRYVFFFFNLSYVDTAELHALLELRTSWAPELSTREEDQHRAAKKKAGYRDPRRIAASVPVKRVAAMLNQMRMGFRPSQLDLANLVNAAREAAVIRAVGTIMDGGHNSSQEGRDYIQTANMLTQLLSEIGSPDGALQKELQLLALKTDGEEVVLLSQLSGGEHTVDLQPSTTTQGESLDVE